MNQTRGISLKTTALAATAFAVIIVGSALLKTRHLSGIAERLVWHGPEFRLDRPDYDRVGFEARSERDPRARQLFAEAMVDFLHGDDKGAQARFLRAAGHEPDWPMLRFYLGTSRLLLGFPLAAADDLQRAVDAGFHPPGARSEWWLAVARMYCGQREEGYRLLEVVAASDTSHATQARDLLARIDQL